MEREEMRIPARALGIGIRGLCVMVPDIGPIEPAGALHRASVLPTFLTLY